MNLIDIINKDLDLKTNEQRFASLTEEEARAEIRSICMTLTDNVPEERDGPVDYNSKGYKLWHRAVGIQLRYIGAFKDKFGVQY